MDKSVTREGIKVEVGQVWRDLDVRMYSRRVTVESVDAEAGTALVRNSAGRKSKLSIKRMHNHGQGFALESSP